MIVFHASVVFSLVFIAVVLFRVFSRLNAQLAILTPTQKSCNRIAIELEYLKSSQEGLKNTAELADQALSQRISVANGRLTSTEDAIEKFAPLETKLLDLTAAHNAWSTGLELRLTALETVARDLDATFEVRVSGRDKAIGDLAESIDVIEGRLELLPDQVEQRLRLFVTEMPVEFRKAAAQAYRNMADAVESIEEEEEITADAGL